MILISIAFMPIIHRKSRLYSACVVVFSYYSYDGVRNLIFRSSRPGLFWKKLFQKNYAKFTGENLCGVSFFNLCCTPATSLKKHSNTSVFLWFSQNFSESLFNRTPSGDCFILNTFGNLKYKFLFLSFTHIKLD